MSPYKVLKVVFPGGTSSPPQPFQLPPHPPTHDSHQSSLPPSLPTRSFFTLLRQKHPGCTIPRRASYRSRSSTRELCKPLSVVLSSGGYSENAASPQLCSPELIPTLSALRLCFHECLNVCKYSIHGQVMGGTKP